MYIGVVLIWILAHVLREWVGMPNFRAKNVKPSTNNQFNMEGKTMTISMEKQYITKSGLIVRIYALNGADNYPIHGAYLRNGEWHICTWNKEGVNSYGADLTLVEVKPRIQREYWVNVYSDLESLPNLVITKKDADNFRSSGRIACVKITIDCEEGDGL